jgi:hypothetical protein
MTQRDMMRSLVKAYAPDWERVCQEYALAEACGKVQRHRNRYALTGMQYAHRLLFDGQDKHWLKAWH